MNDSYTLEYSFAVFIEKCPFAEHLLDYDQLYMGQLVLGSLVNTEGGHLHCLNRS